MSKSIKLSVLILTLIASLFFLSIEITKASTALEGKILFMITSGVSSCIYGTSLSLGNHITQYESFSLTGTFNPDTFSCTDLDGLDSWNMSLYVPNDLSNGLQTIPKENVFLHVDSNILVSGFCTTGLNSSIFTSIGTQPGTILSKISSAGDVCTISAHNVQIAVQVPTYQAIGTYTGTLILTSPR